MDESLLPSSIDEHVNHTSIINGERDLIKRVRVVIYDLRGFHDSIKLLELID